MDEPPLGRLSTLIGFDVRGTIGFYRIELTHRRKIMRDRSIAAAVVVAGIAIGISSIAVAHEDHDKASEPTAFTAMALAQSPSPTRTTTRLPSPRRSPQ